MVPTLQETIPIVNVVDDDDEEEEEAVVVAAPAKQVALDLTTEQILAE